MSCKDASEPNEPHGKWVCSFCELPILTQEVCVCPENSPKAGGEKVHG